MARYKGNLKAVGGDPGGSFGPDHKKTKVDQRYATGEVSEYPEQLEVGPRLKKLLTAKIAARALAKRSKSA